MTKALRDPDLPPGAVVEMRSGVPIRNDGKRLKPAAQNPWYVLATIAGEQEGTFLRYEVDEDLAARNRRYWNGWACSEMSEDDRAALADKLDLPVEELAPLTEEEQKIVRREFTKRLGDNVPVPVPSETIDFRETHFSHTRVWEKCAFPVDAGFESATFSGSAWFRSATFSGDADFVSATFSGRADFGSATFSRFAEFRSATFSGNANFFGGAFSLAATFEAATFSRYAGFVSATFSGPATFGSATFSEYANFSDGAFKARTDFETARFVRQAPIFHQRDLHQDTALSADEAYWPVITEDNAKDGKRAYVRLRQLMNGLHKPDDEHFFFRQEMRCDAVLKKGLDAWVVRLFGVVSGFGFSVARPLLGLAGVIVICWPIIASHLKHAQGVPGNGGIWQGLGVSFSNTFGFLGFGRLMHPEFFVAAPAWLDALSGLQTVLGVVLLFFLGLGLRNRFRLK